MPAGNSGLRKFFALFLYVATKVDLNDAPTLFWIDTLREATKFCKRIGGKDMRLDIKVAIVKSGRKQYEIAQELGVPEATLSKYVRGYGVLSQDHATKLAQLIGLDEEGGASAEADPGHAAHTH
jgi:Helix-turn-helix